MVVRACFNVKEFMAILILN